MSKKIGWLLAFLFIIGWGAALIIFPSADVFRYMLTVNVNTPDGVKSGYSIIEVTYERPKSIEVFVGPRFSSSFIGEAVFIDLGRDKNVLLTLTDFRSASPQAVSLDYLPVRLFKLPWGISDAADEMSVAVKRAKYDGEKVVSPDLLPLLITFRNLNTPTSLERVDPLDFAAVFGAGYSLKEVSIRASDLPVAQDLEKKLTWLSSLPFDKGLDGGYFTHKSEPFMIGPRDLLKKG